MATLEELLALAPDNSTGAIDAADLRSIITGLWDYTLAVQSTLNDVIVDVAALVSLRHAGHVDTSGVLVSGPQGWTAAQDETGIYTVTHGLGVDPERYAVTVTPMSLVTQAPVIAQITATAPDSFTYRLCLTDGTNVNRDANFTAQIT